MVQLYNSHSFLCELWTWWLGLTWPRLVPLPSLWSLHHGGWSPYGTFQLKAPRHPLDLVSAKRFHQLPSLGRFLDLCGEGVLNCPGEKTLFQCVWRWKVCIHPNLRSTLTQLWLDNPQKSGNVCSLGGFLYDFRWWRLVERTGPKFI